VKSEFINFDVAAFAGESVWIGGKAIDATAVSELKDIGRCPNTPPRLSNNYKT